jgi:hypothetical protein
VNEVEADPGVPSEGAGDTFSWRDPRVGYPLFQPYDDGGWASMLRPGAEGWAVLVCEVSSYGYDEGVSDVYVDYHDEQGTFQAPMLAPVVIQYTSVLDENGELPAHHDADMAVLEDSIWLPGPLVQITRYSPLGDSEAVGTPEILPARIYGGEDFEMLAGYVPVLMCTPISEEGAADMSTAIRHAGVEHFDDLFFDNVGHQEELDYCLTGGGIPEHAVDRFDRMFCHHRFEAHDAERVSDCDRSDCPDGPDEHEHARAFKLFRPSCEGRCECVWDDGRCACGSTVPTMDQAKDLALYRVQRGGPDLLLSYLNPDLQQFWAHALSRYAAAIQAMQALTTHPTKEIAECSSSSLRPLSPLPDMSLLPRLLRALSPHSTGSARSQAC